MGVIETRVGRLGAEVRGRGGVPLLFLHGVGSDRSAWRPQQDRFDGERLTVSIDYPGYGDSDLVAGATRDTYADAALAVLDALGCRQAHVCGLSLGGVVALAMAGRSPERIASLILADTFACHPEGQEIHDRSLAGAAALGMRGLAESRAGALLAHNTSAELRQQVVETMARIDPEAYALAARAVWLADQRKVAAAVDGPVLIMCGSEDRITPPSLSDELEELIPQAGVVEIAGAGHLSNLEQPEIFNRVLAAFLGEVEASSPRSMEVR